MEDFDRAKRFRRMTAAMSKDSVWRAIRLHDLGVPVFIDEPPPGLPATAMVGVQPNGAVLFMFCREFFDSLGDSHLITVIEHELGHILLDHPNRALTQVRRETKNGKTTFNREFWNIAADVLDNEILFARGALVLPKEELERIWTIDKLHKYIKDFPQYVDVTDPAATREIPRRLAYDTETLYELICKSTKKIVLDFAAGSMDGHQEPQEGDGEGEGGGSGDEKSENDKKIQQAIEDMQQAAKEAGMGDGASDKAAAAGAGRSATGTCPEFRKLNIAPVKTATDWRSIVAKYWKTNFEFKYQESWARPNRKLAGFPDVCLPVEFEDENQSWSIYVLGDSSGSMINKSPIVAGLVIEILGALIDKKHEDIKVDLWSFDTEIYPWTPDQAEAGEMPGMTGGTAFQKCAEFVEGRCGSQPIGNFKESQFCEKHPDLVIMITDGECPIPKIEFPEKWMWILVDPSHYGVGAKTQGVGMVYQFTGNEIVEGS